MKPEIEHIINIWREDPGIASNITTWQSNPAVSAQWRDLPEDLNQRLSFALSRIHIDKLYSHQLESWNAVRKGQNIVVVTGTSSGKTLCYNLPVLDALQKDPQTRALYIFPTKALAQDQAHVLHQLTDNLEDPPNDALFQIYDGDTPSEVRSFIRSKSNIVLTNPDMIHVGILPHHTIWQNFFRNLRFVVIDEIHTYRGVFGSHVANLIRRLKRIMQFYGAKPQFILTSATIANPSEHAQRLIEAPVTLISNDGASHGDRHFMIYNPPIIDHNLGLRRNSTLESVHLVRDLYDHNVQTIMFGRTRRTIELALTYLRTNTEDTQTIHGYRSGYLPTERRGIERGLKNGEIRVVVATNALELGIDIGGVDAVVMIGYPGTIASTLQEAGRAGRKTDPALSILVASADPLDQFLAHHPQYLFDRSPEQALIQPDHLLIVLNHLRCAAFELPFHIGDPFGTLSPEIVIEYLRFLEASGVLHQSKEQFYWMADQYPADSISLRSTSPDTFLLQVEEAGLTRTIGKVDQASVFWMVHPDAVYLHEGQQYLVNNLDLEKKIAYLQPFHLDYYTEARKDSSVEKKTILKTDPMPGGGKAYGDLVVTTTVSGFRRIKWVSHEVLGISSLDLPSNELITTGYWLWLDETAVDHLKSEGLWTNAPNDYGPSWPVQRKRVLERDHYRCQVCGTLEIENGHHIHHKKPFRSFTNPDEANNLDNLITLCPNCHHKVEQAVRIRSGLAGVSYLLGKLAPLFLMCDEHDLGISSDPQSPLADGQPTVIIYDNIPGGLGLSEHLYDLHSGLINRAYETVLDCNCLDGCPSCVGPAGENGIGGKRETLAIFTILKQKTSRV